MRQRSDIPRNRRLQQALEDLIQGEADTTIINGLPLQGDWEEAQPNRVQQFLADYNLQHAYYFVTFAGSTVIEPPYSLKDGMTIVWKTVGWQGVVRRVTPDTDNDVIIGFVALVQIM